MQQDGFNDWHETCHFMANSINDPVALPPSLLSLMCLAPIAVPTSLNCMKTICPLSDVTLVVDAGQQAYGFSHHGKQSNHQGYIVFLCNKYFIPMVMLVNPTSEKKIACSSTV